MTEQQFRFKNNLPIFDSGSLEAIARVIGDTTNGLTGSEIQRHLADCQIADIDTDNTKWKRIYNALVDFQNKHRVGNHVINLINRVMKPSLYLKNESRFHWLRDNLNEALSFCGYQVDDAGVVKYATQLTTLEEAKARASTLRNKLAMRNAHVEVFRFCDEQLLQNNYFHATLESVKSITSRVRQISKLSGDGAPLINSAFSSINGLEPIIKINAYDTETQKGEQRGFTNLLIGLYGVFRGYDQKLWMSFSLSC